MIQFKSAAFGVALLAMVGGGAFAQDAAQDTTKSESAAAPAKEAAAPAAAMSKGEIAQLKTCKSLSYRTMLRNKMCKAFLAAHPGAIPAPN